VTVRTWYRLQRAAIWARGDTFAHDIDRIATLVTRDQDVPLEWLRVGPVYWIESVESEVERQRILEMVQRDMAAAMSRLFAKDIAR